MKYSVKKKTIVVTAPKGAGVTFRVSDGRVATAKWSNKWSGNKTKLTIYGHARGKATITLTNSKTSKKIKVKVTVGGYDLGFRFGNSTDEVKQYKKSDGTNGYYSLNNFSIKNYSKKKAVFAKKSAFKVWTINAEGKYVEKGTVAKLRNIPVAIKAGKTKAVYVGEKMYMDAQGNYIDGQGDAIDASKVMTFWEKARFTIKLGGSWKTVYVDGYGMVTKVNNGRDF